jgi:hypothetical protein
MSIIKHNFLVAVPDPHEIVPGRFEGRLEIIADQGVNTGQHKPRFF